MRWAFKIETFYKNCKQTRPKINIIWGWLLRIALNHIEPHTLRVLEMFCVKIAFFIYFRTKSSNKTIEDESKDESSSDLKNCGSVGTARPTTTTTTIGSQPLASPTINSSKANPTKDQEPPLPLHILKQTIKAQVNQSEAINQTQPSPGIKNNRSSQSFGKNPTWRSNYLRDQSHFLLYYMTAINPPKKQIQRNSLEVSFRFNPRIKIEMPFFYERLSASSNLDFEN